MLGLMAQEAWRGEGPVTGHDSFPPPRMGGISSLRDVSSPEGGMGWGAPLGGVKYLGRPAWHPPSPGSPGAAAGRGWPVWGENGAKKKVKGRTQRLDQPPRCSPSGHSRTGEGRRLPVKQLAANLPLHPVGLASGERPRLQGVLSASRPSCHLRPLPAPGVPGSTYVACELVHGAILGHVVFLVRVVLWDRQPESLGQLLRMPQPTQHLSVGPQRHLLADTRQDTPSGTN